MAHGTNFLCITNVHRDQDNACELKANDLLPEKGQSTKPGVGGGTSQVSMKPAYQLGSNFVFHYHIIKAASNLSRGEERKTSKRESLTHDCERGVRATMMRSLARHVTSRQAHIDARTLTCFALLPTVFEEKRGHSQSKIRIITKLCSSAIL